MTIKNNRVTLTRKDVATSRLNGYKVAELDEALTLAGYELIIEAGK
jgi:hypothetical protein